MSQSKRRAPPRLFRQRRNECRESAQFRAEMQRSQFGFDPHKMDCSELERLCEFIGVLPLKDVEGQPPVILIRPLGAFADYADFDRAVAAAGLPQFVRPIMDSDRPKGPLPPELEATFDLATHVLVVAVARGIRVRRPVYFQRTGEVSS